MAKAARDPEERIRERNMRLIIKAGIEIFARKGFDGTRIAEIAEAWACPRPTSIITSLPRKRSTRPSSPTSSPVGTTR